MLHGKFVYAVVFRGAGFASDAVGIALETGGYRAAAAHELAVKLSAKPRMVRKLVASSVLFGRVVAHLHRGLSPEQIAFTRNRIDQPVRISHETIYTALYAIHLTDEDLSAGTLATGKAARSKVNAINFRWALWSSAPPSM